MGQWYVTPLALTVNLYPRTLTWSCRSNDQDLGGGGYVRGYHGGAFQGLKLSLSSENNKTVVESALLKLIQHLMKLIFN